MSTSPTVIDLSTYRSPVDSWFKHPRTASHSIQSPFKGIWFNFQSEVKTRFPHKSRPSKESRQMRREKIKNREGERWNLPLEERRKFYKILKYATIDSIPTLLEAMELKSPRNSEYSQNSCSDSDMSTSSSSMSTTEPNLKHVCSKISLYSGSVVDLEVDAIVNAANKFLFSGGGVCGAIHSAAGLQLQKECNILPLCKTGKSKITRGYNLPAKYVIHAVGPRGYQPEKLEKCYLHVLKTCVKNGIRTVAFCGISTGIYGFPMDLAALVAVRTIKSWLMNSENINKIDRVIFCCFLSQELKLYKNELSDQLSEISFLTRKDLPKRLPVENNRWSDKKQSKMEEDKMEEKKTDIRHDVSKTRYNKKLIPEATDPW